MNANSSKLHQGSSGRIGKYTTIEGIRVAHKIKQCKNKVREGQLIRRNDPHVVLMSCGIRKGKLPPNLSNSH